MWDSTINSWNAARMGPKRDVTGELATAIRARGMKFAATFHHAQNWYMFPHRRLALRLRGPPLS